jgi:hypothetical protein
MPEQGSWKDHGVWIGIAAVVALGTPDLDLELVMKRLRL